jgi:hypothetical protein
MNDTSEVPTVVNQRIGKTTKWNCASVRRVHDEELTLSSLGLAQEHYPIQLPGHGGQAVLERGGCFHCLETFQSFENQIKKAEERYLGAAVANRT